MGQNRNKLVDLFIGNLVNAVLHRILEKAIIEDIEVSSKYKKEIINSWNIAKIYREKINPKRDFLPLREATEIKERLIRRVSSEISARIARGYKNLSLEDVEREAESALKEFYVAE